MQTISHFLMTGAVNHQLRQKTIPIHSKALLIGSVLPSAPCSLSRAKSTIAGSLCRQPISRSWNTYTSTSSSPIRCGSLAIISSIRS